MESNFVKTSDKETADALINEGFVLLHKDNNIWTFVNDKQKKLSFNGNKIVYTDKVQV